MTKILRSSAISAIVVALMCTVPAVPRAADPLPLNPGEHICIIGNMLAERMQYDGWLDTLLHARFPKHDLVIRNLGFSGDEITTRLRSKNFGSPDEWLSARGATVGGYSVHIYAVDLRNSQGVDQFFPLALTVSGGKVVRSE